MKNNYIEMHSGSDVESDHIISHFLKSYINHIADNTFKESISESWSNGLYMFR